MVLVQNPGARLGDKCPQVTEVGERIDHDLVVYQGILMHEHVTEADSLGHSTGEVGREHTVLAEQPDRIGVGIRCAP